MSKLSIEKNEKHNEVHFVKYLKVKLLKKSQICPLHTFQLLCYRVNLFLVIQLSVVVVAYRCWQLLQWWIAQPDKEP